MLSAISGVSIEYDESTKRRPPGRGYISAMITRRRIIYPRREESILSILGRGNNCTKMWIFLTSDGLVLEGLSHILC